MDIDEIYAYDPAISSDDDDRGGVISGGFVDGAAAASTKRSRRQSTHKAPKYKEASSSSSEDAYEDLEDDSDEVVVVEKKKKAVKKKGPVASAKKPSPPQKKAPTPSKPPPKLKSPPKAAAAAAKKEKSIDDGKKVAAATSSSAKAKSAAAKNIPNIASEGIDVVIPHSLLNKHTGTGKNECTMLVQVPDNDETSHHLDFHGQSGAIGRFEADEEGGECIEFTDMLFRISSTRDVYFPHQCHLFYNKIVILDLKGYQYRGHIRPGPTAMVVALNRDGQFKVEAITDEFVTLDTSTKTDMMAKLDAVVKGDMDDTYRYREINVNANKKKGKGGDDDKEGEGDNGGKTGKKRVRASTGKNSGGAPA